MKCCNIMHRPCQANGCGMCPCHKHCFKEIVLGWAVNPSSCGMLEQRTCNTKNQISFYLTSREALALHKWRKDKLVHVLHSETAGCCILKLQINNILEKHLQSNKPLPHNE